MKAITGYLGMDTREGCKRWVAILAAVILLTSFFAALISSDGGKIKIESISIDARGAELTGDLYYPAGTTDEDSYPAVILVPGAGVIKENMRGFAEELARRGYVVFNVNPYGNGLSETPVYNENDMGIKQFNIFATPLGVLDAVHFLRSIEFVDDTRIGLSGHSQGSRRAGYAALMDCGYYTFNDMMINLLNETFEVEIAAEDIVKDADAVAADKLTPEALKLYEKMREDYRVDYESMVRSICLIGSTAQFCNPTATVQVAGHDVVRTCKMNECIINGTYDYGYKSFNNDAKTKESWYVPADQDIVNEGYYALNDVEGTSELIGAFRKDTILNNDALKQAIADRSLRIVMLTGETHSKNFFSSQTTARVVDYFNQTLNNHPDVVSTGSGEIVFVFRELLNAIAMFAMIGLMVPLIKLFLLDKRYAGIADRATYDTTAVKPAAYVRWIILALTVVFGFIAIYNTCNGKNLFKFSANLSYPLMITAWTTVQLLAWLALSALALLVIYLALTRGFKDFLGFIKNNIMIGVKNILRTLVIAGAFIFTAYLMLTAAEYLFQQDFRWWMTAYAELKANHWLYVFNYAVLMLPFFLIISCGVNYISDKTILVKRAAADTALTVVANSLGLWLCCFVSYAMAYWGIKTDGLFASFILTYGAMVTVPINVFVLRKSYQQTKSVWTGVIICSILTAWLLVSTSGMNGSYIPQSWLSIFLGR